MKKLLAVIAIAILGIGISACSVNESKEVLSSEQSLVSMAYLSTSLLSMNQDPSSNALAMSLSDDEFEVDSELETVNEYLEMLKAFMENGADDFASIEELPSDNEMYTYMINIAVFDEVFVLYYNINQETKEISGVFVIGDEEYVIEAYDNLEDEDEEEDEDDEEEYDDDEMYKDDEEEDEDEEEDKDDMSFNLLTESTEQPTTEYDSTSGATVGESDDSERKMVLIARNGDNYIEMTYKIETEDDEVETKFEMKSFINEVEKEIEIKIENEKDEYKVEIEDGENYYELKREFEDEGIEYKLEYQVNGVEGEIKITETTDEFGEKVYVYEIDEEGKYKEVEIDDHDDEDEFEDEAEDTKFVI